MPDTKSKRKPKFGHLKVGDEVVIERSSEGRGIAIVSRVDTDESEFWVIVNLCGHRREALISMFTGKGKRGSMHSYDDYQAHILPAIDMATVRDEQDHAHLSAEFNMRMHEWSKLDVLQLRRIRTELDAATTEPRVGPAVKPD